MQKNYFLIAILALSLIANGLFLFSEKKTSSLVEEKEKFIVDIFKDKMFHEIFTEYLEVNPFEQLFDLKGNPINLNSIIEDSKKLILIISDNACGACIENNLNALSNLSTINTINEIIVLGLFENKREFFLHTKKYPFKFFLLSENSFLRETAMNSPVFFTINVNYKIEAAFYPVSIYPELTEKYLNQILHNMKP